jgi:hypothetical protein
MQSSAANARSAVQAAAAARAANSGAHMRCNWPIGVELVHVFTAASHFVLVAVELSTAGDGDFVIATLLSVARFVFTVRNAPRIVGVGGFCLVGVSSAVTSFAVVCSLRDVKRVLRVTVDIGRFCSSPEFS